MKGVRAQGREAGEWKMVQWCEACQLACAEGALQVHANDCISAEVSRLDCAQPAR